MVKFAPGSQGLLQPVQHWLDDDEVSEILVNKPNEVWIEKRGQLTVYSLPEFSHLHLMRLFQLIANENQQLLNESHPLLSGSLSKGERVQLCLSPTAKHPAMAIRKQIIHNHYLEDYQQTDFFSQVTPITNIKQERAASNRDEAVLLEHYQNQNWFSFIKQAILFKKNIVIAGGTSSGKTTFLNACLKEIPDEERLIILEDTRELQAPHLNQVQLLGVKDQQSKNTITMQDLVQCSLRLRPDRIIMGEIRGSEILDFISACSTGHEGTLTSIHANNPRVAFSRMLQMYKLNPVSAMTDADILQQIHEVVDIIIQLKKTSQGRKITEIYFKDIAQE